MRRWRQNAFATQIVLFQAHAELAFCQRGLVLENTTNQSTRHISASGELSGEKFWCIKMLYRPSACAVHGVSLVFPFKGRLLILDLDSAARPQYVRANYYYGQPFIWCLLSNSGGTLGFYSRLDIINTVLLNRSYSFTLRPLFEGLLRNEASQVLFVFAAGGGDLKYKLCPVFQRCTVSIFKHI